jgi:alpha-1,6-mannosyltransferase
MRMTERSRAFSAAHRTLAKTGLVLARLRAPEPDAEPFVPGQTRIARSAIVPAVTGAVGAVLVLWGASQPTSPFTLNHVTLKTLSDTTLQFGSPWYFGTGPVGVQAGVLAGVVAVYAGMFLMIRGWVALVRLTRLHPGMPVRTLVPVLIAWMLPLLVVAPLFSHDAYSYVAQGEEMSRGINPYLYPTSVLGPGGSAYSTYVDSLWSNTTSPYGPVFIGLAGLILEVVHHSELAALVGFRVLAVLGVVLLAVYTPRLARTYGRDAAKAFALVALNPLVLLHLVAGEHNDALMMGLLVAGLALARERHPAIGIVLCSLAGLVKAPALIGVVYVGWDWAGVGVPWRGRVRLTATALVISGATMAAVTYAVGLGWRWILALGNPGSVSSWMDPATGIGGLIGRAVSGVGLGYHTPVILAVTRGIGLVLAALIAVRLLLRSDGGVSSLRAMGLTLLAVVALGPVAQPWYFVWGVVLLAPIAEGRTRVALIWLSAVMSFLGLPGGRALLSRLSLESPFVVAGAVALLVAVVLASYSPRLRQLTVEWRERDRLSVPAEAHTGGSGGSS